MKKNLRATGTSMIETGARTLGAEAVIVPVGSYCGSQAYRTALLMFTLAVVLVSSCPAQSLPFSATVNSTQSCTFNGLSFSSQLTETISNAKSNANFGSYSFQDFVVTKIPDACSNSFYALVATGARVPTVVLTVQGELNGSAVVLEQITLSDVVITSLQNSYQSASLVETLKLSYRTIATLWFNGSAEIKSIKEPSKSKS